MDTLTTLYCGEVELNFPTFLLGTLSLKLLLLFSAWWLIISQLSEWANERGELGQLHSVGKNKGESRQIKGLVHEFTLNSIVEWGGVGGVGRCPEGWDTCRIKYQKVK